MQTISIDTTLIPEESGRAIAQGACSLVQKILSQPGGREALDKKKMEIAERRKRDGKGNAKGTDRALQRC